MEDGGREIRILNFAVSIASRNKNIEDEEFRIFELFERFSGVSGAGALFLPDLRCTGYTDRLRRS